MNAHTSRMPTSVNNNNSGSNSNIRFNLSSKELSNLLSKVAREAAAKVLSGAAVKEADDEDDEDDQDDQDEDVPSSGCSAASTFQRTINEILLKSIKGSKPTVKEEETILRKVLVEIDKRISSGQCCPQVLIPANDYPNCLRLLDKIVSESGIDIPCGMIKIAATCPGCESRRSEIDHQNPRKRHCT